jgi:hydroxybutyrate-dimer hydrolase
MQNDTANGIDGVRAAAPGLGSNAAFVPTLPAGSRAAFNAATPNRFAYKHAHSQTNPEKDWGQNTLDAIEFAFWVLNQTYSPIDAASGRHTVTLQPGSTIVIAASVSNGGGAALAAAEQDTKGLISGVVAGEPQIQPSARAIQELSIVRGSTPVTSFGKPLYDYFTIANLYQPCAALSVEAASTSTGASLVTVSAAKSAARCAALAAQGYLTASTTVAQQAEEALGKLHEAGWQPESDLLHAIHYSTFATPSVTLTYANSYGRFSVLDNKCGYSFGATDAAGASTPANAVALGNLFGSGNGVPPSGGLVNVLQNRSVGAPVRFDLTTSTISGAQDYDQDGAACLRNLWTGGDASAQAVRSGIAEVQRTGNLRGKPAILVQGRADTLVPINHASRAYYGANRLAEAANANVRLYEVANAQHFDAFLPVAGLAARLVPLHRYVVNSLDLLYAHLKNGTALPASQVVRTTPRGAALPNITPANVPAIAAPSGANAITFSAGTLTVPD